MTCANISKNIVAASCRNSVAAIEPDIVLINFDDYAAATKTVSGNVISALTLPSGKYGYRWTGHKNSFEASFALNKGTYVNSLTHGIVVRLFDRSQDAKDEINKLLNGRVVAIVKAKDGANPETRYEVYGHENGLTVSDLQYASTDGDGVISSFNLSSDDDARESQLPLSFFSTSEATTKAAIDSLVYTEPSGSSE